MAVLSDDMGGITAYAAAVNRGYTGTKEEFEQLMYSYTEVAERAEAAAGNAHESEEASIEAKDIAVSAKNEAVSARDAAQSARDASISAKNDSESARDASISAKNDTLAAKDAVMSAKGSVDETSANFSDAVTAAISDVNAAGRNQKELAKTHAIDSEAWAVGQREGADVGVSDETYHNNSKYYAEQSALAKSETETARDTAITAKNDAIAAKNEAETAKGDAQDIVDGINAKSEQIAQNTSDISELKEDLTNLQSIVWTEGYISAAGTIITGGGRYYSNLLICPPNTSVSYVAETNHSNILGISFYDVSGTLISGVANNGAIGTEMTVTSPNGCAFCRLSTTTAYKDKSYYKIAAHGIEYIVKSLVPLNGNKYLPFVTNGTNRSLVNTDVENILTATVVNSDYLIVLFYNDGGVSRNTGWVTSVNTLAVSGTFVSWQLKRVDDAVMPSGILADIVEVVRASDLVTRKDMASTGYVSKSGSDSNSGLSRLNALLTISSAISKGYKNIIIGEGTYAESLTLTGVCGLHISLDMSGNNYSATDNPDNPKVIIDGGNSNANGIVMTDCYDCTFEDIEVCNFTRTAWTIGDCSGITFIDCVAHDIAIGQHVGGGYMITDSNVDFYNCVAYNIGTTVKGTNTYHIDGFNIHNTGTVNLFNCSAWNCEDDGASHHDACCGVIDGGEWHDCGKGGVSSPTHGAKVDVRNVYCHDNNYAGIYADSDHVFEDRGKTIFSNCVCKNNPHDMIVGDEYSVIAINCVYDTVIGSANITRFGIT